MVVGTKRSALDRKPTATPDERRTRILAAATREFGSQGFAAASTNAIAEEAGVAKGLLFHHYGSKEALFTAAFDDVVERILASIFDETEPLPTDLFERLGALHVRKLKFFRQEPDACRLVWTTVTALPETFRRELIERQKARMGKHWTNALRGVDTSRLRPGLSLADAAETISMVLEGLDRVATQALSSGAGRTVSLRSLQKTALMHLYRLRDGLYS